MRHSYITFSLGANSNWTGPFRLRDYLSMATSPRASGDSLCSPVFASRTTSFVLILSQNKMRLSDSPPLSRCHVKRNQGPRVITHVQHVQDPPDRGHATPCLTEADPRCDPSITAFLHSWNQIYCPENFLIALVSRLTTGLGCAT